MKKYKKALNILDYEINRASKEIEHDHRELLYVGLDGNEEKVVASTLIEKQKVFEALIELRERFKNEVGV